MINQSTTLQDKIQIGTLHPVTGFMVAGVKSGLRKNGRPDFSIVYSDQDCAAAGVFTTNQVKAAPVLVDMERLAHNPSQIRAVVTNSAVANACTGEEGLANAYRTAELVADALGIEPEQVLVLSTGVIGVQLPMDKMAYGAVTASGVLAPDEWHTAASAIMTTDTRSKAYSLQCNGYTITGIAKGSGMIAPNMATMLSIISTDAQIEQSKLQQALNTVNGRTFNRISVDGDTSTNDTVLLLANGASGVVVESDAEYQDFVEALSEAAAELAQMIVRDGEGATKFITIEVTGAVDEATAHTVANTIATSPLVKTAFYGQDANWGRIIAAAGRSGVALDSSKLKLWFGSDELADEPLCVFENGQPTDYLEGDAAAMFAQEEILVRLDLASGDAMATVWTCDLSHGYVSINADYRT